MTRVYVSVIVYSSESQRYLILKRTATAKFAPSQWEFVNGTIDTGEVAEQTAVRELYEETGLRIEADQLEPLPSHELTDEDGRWIVIPYLVNHHGSTIELCISEEHSDYRWVSKEELLSIPYVGDDYSKLMNTL